MLSQDYLMRQIQRIGELIAALAESGAEKAAPDVESEVDGAYGDLLGLDPRLATTLQVESLVPMLLDPSQVFALAGLFAAHGDVRAVIGDLSAARFHWRRAQEALERCVPSQASPEDPEAVDQLARELEARLAG